MNLPPSASASASSSSAARRLSCVLFLSFFLPLFGPLAPYLSILFLSATLSCSP